MRVPLPNTVRHHGLGIPRGMIVRTMRGQHKPRNGSPDWIEFIPGIGKNRHGKNALPHL
jgi:hypothetical protein